MDVKSCDPMCPIKCKHVLEEIKFATTEFGQSDASERPEEISSLFEKFSKSLGLGKNRDCCSNVTNCKLLHLSWIRSLFVNLECFKERDSIFYWQHGVEDSNSQGESVVKLRVIFDLFKKENLVLFMISSIYHSDRFVRYKASEIFVEYFKQCPCILVNYKDELECQFSDCIKNCRIVLIGLLQKLLKSFRKILEEVTCKSGLPFGGDACARITLFSLLLRMLSCGRSCSMFEDVENKNYESVIRLRALYEAEKLKRCILQIKTKEFDNLRNFHWFEELEILLKDLRVFVNIYHFDWKDIFEGKSFDSSVTFYKLKIILLKVTSHFGDNTIQQATEILTLFVEDSQSLMDINLMGFCGLGGKMVDNELALLQSADYKQITPNLRLFTLLILKCFLLALKMEESKDVQGKVSVFDLCRVTICLLSLHCIVSFCLEISSSISFLKSAKLKILLINY